ncbi:MAG: transcriptional repressor LexA [Actinobacteria bacterium]|nr:transcriptional repressor LexA [Actinomycetota bacterium]
MPLTERQLAILEAIEDLMHRNGYPPTVREIGSAVGLSSPASVQNHLHALERAGYVRRGSLKRRALEIVKGAGGRTGRGIPHKSSMVVLPLVGRVAAGTPLLADEHVEEELQVPDYLTQAGDCFLLRVKGSSMINAGILDGDLVVVRKQGTAVNGDIVVVVLGEEATVKRFFLEEDHVRLQPENGQMEPIIVREPVIAGKVVGVMRRI